MSCERTNRWAVLLKRRGVWRLVLVLLLLAIGTAAGHSARLGQVVPPRAAPPDNILPAEFEHHQLMVMSWDRLMPIRQWSSLGQMMAHASHNVDVLVLVGDESTQPQAETMLEEFGGNRERVTFVRSPSHRAWVRDFGPFMVRTPDAGVRLLDTGGSGNINAIDDNRVPLQLARLWGAKLHSLPLVLEGGNVLSNGAGLLLTSRTTLLANEAAGHSQAQVETWMRNEFGAQQVVYLVPLFGERTGHVDMFCTFTDPNTVVVGRYDPQHDPINAAILDRNVEQLSGLVTPQGRLKIVRLPMPERKLIPGEGRDFWFTYTNVTFVNGKLLVPTYQGVDPAVEQQALDIYRQLLPDWEIIGIECDALLKSSGALHCASKQIIRLPEQQDHERSRTFLPTAY